MQNSWNKISTRKWLIAAERKRRKKIARQAEEERQKNVRPVKRAKKRKVSPFFKTEEWKRVRYAVLKRDGGRCQLCGRCAHDGVILNVDHIKPRHKFPELALDQDNLQTLCGSCNAGKGAYDKTDWRPKVEEIDASLDMHLLAELRERGLLN